MSTLDKAFIKAFQRQGVGGPHVRFAEPPAPAAIGGASIETLVAHKPREAESADALGDAVVETDPPKVEVAAADDLKAAFEIACFKWPNIVPALVDNRQPELAALVDELLPLAQGSLAVSSCRRGEGRTAVSLVVARQLAAGGARVVVVDADTEQPKLAETLCTAAEVGWVETLTAQQSPYEAMIESVGDRLAILPLKGSADDSSLAACANDLKQMCRQLQAAFDFVCFDLGPSIENLRWHSELCASGLDAVVVVRDVRHCRLEQAQAVGRKFADLGAAHWAIIENFV